MLYEDHFCDNKVKLSLSSFLTGHRNFKFTVVFIVYDNPYQRSVIDY